MKFPSTGLISLQFSSYFVPHGLSLHPLEHDHTVLVQALSLTLHPEEEECCRMMKKCSQYSQGAGICNLLHSWGNLPQGQTCMQVIFTQLCSTRLLWQRAKHSWVSFQVPYRLWYQTHWHCLRGYMLKGPKRHVKGLHMQLWSPNRQGCKSLVSQQLKGKAWDQKSEVYYVPMPIFHWLAVSLQKTPHTWQGLIGD